MSNDHEAAPRATRRRNRRVPAVAGLILALLASGPATARGGERHTPQAQSARARAASPASPQAATARKESPYARYAREHAMKAPKDQARVKATRATTHGPHGRAGGPVKGLAGWLAGASLLLATPAGAGEVPAKPPASPRAPAPKKPAMRRAARLSTQARLHFRAAWGVDSMRLSRVASGNLIRFDYRVTDPVQAAPLVDKNATPVLYAPRVGAVLSVPVMEKIGPLRQTGTLKAGQSYWVTFSNRGNLVKPGDRVDVVIGRFHAEGLMVE